MLYNFWIFILLEGKFCFVCSWNPDTMFWKVEFLAGEELYLNFPRTSFELFLILRITAANLNLRVHNFLCVVLHPN